MFLIIHKYLAKQFLKSFFGVLLFIILLIYAAETIEFLRRIGSHKTVSFWNILYISFLKLPQTVQILLPFIFLFAGMLTFSNLTKYKELMVMRAAGMSAFRIILPAAILSFFLGFIYVLFLNPVFTEMSQKYKTYKDSLSDKKKDILDISGSGVWIRDGGNDDQSYFIYVSSMDEAARQFEDVTFYRYKDARYIDRIDAKIAILNRGDWLIQNPKIIPIDSKPYELDVLHLVSTIQFESISDYLVEPEMLSFWQLSEYIDQLKKHHFKSDRYEIYYHSLLSKPFLFLGMILFAGIFSFQRSRLGQKTSMLIGGITCGLGLFFFNNIMLVLGLNESVPLFIAAWGSTYFILALSFFILSKIEE